MNEKIIGLNALKEYDKQLQEAHIKPLEKNIKELEELIGGGDQPTESKEVVIVDIQTMLATQDVAQFLEISQKLKNGEAIVYGKIGNSMGTITCYEENDTNKIWDSIALGWDSYEGTYTIISYRLMCYGDSSLDIYTQEIDPSDYVMKSEDKNVLYATNDLGLQSRRPYSQDAKEDAIVQRTATGTIKAADPQEDEDVTTKQYVAKEFVKKTDIANANNAGVVVGDKTYGFQVTANGVPCADVIRTDEYAGKTVACFIGKGTLENIKYNYVKEGVTTNTEPLTEEESVNACKWMGALRTEDADDKFVARKPVLPSGSFVYAFDPKGERTQQYSPDNVLYSLVQRRDGLTFDCGTPTAAVNVTNKDYVDNLPDYITLTDEQKEKWRGMIGSGTSSGETTIAAMQINVTWEELKDLRDSSQLIPGQFYRITDYECTTSQENTRSAGHKFDIIVQALSANTLSENVSADYHEGDTYFQTGNKIIESTVPEDFSDTILEVDDVEWLYTIIEDETEELGDYAGVSEGNREEGDVFVAYSYKENSDGIMVPVLYKTDMDPDDDDPSKPNYEWNDYDDEEVFYYVGEYLLDGVMYDKWQKIELPTNTGDFTLDSAAKYYALTNKIVGEGLLIEGNFVYANGDKKNANLPAWELKYCLDNDVTRFAWVNNIFAFKISDGDEIYIYTRHPEKDEDGKFAWAYVNNTCLDVDYDEVPDWNDIDVEDLIYTDSERIRDGMTLDMGGVTVVSVGEMHYPGKGVIYYMKDEYNNETPYDFKNIQFPRALDEEGNFNPDEGIITWCYTFGGTIDRSIKNTGLHTFNNNSIGTYYMGCDENFRIPDNVFLGGNNECMSKNNKLGMNCYGNTFGTQAQSNILGDDCYGNVFGNGCHENTFDFNCRDNILTSECSLNILRGNCYNNIFGDCCNYNILEKNCAYNIFGNGFDFSILEGNCAYNIFGTYCNSNVLGANCCDNIFGDACCHITFGSGCVGNTFAYDDVNKEPEDWFYYINFASGCCYIDLLVDEGGSDDYRVQYITISSGVTGTNEQHKEISVMRRNNETKVPVVYEANNTRHIILD